MDPLVGPPGVVVGEGLVAVGALVQLFLGVAQPVHLQVVGDSEALPAVLAGKGLLAHVEQRDVGPQVGRLGESLPAGGAEEGPLPGVRHHVGLQVWRLREALSALGAAVGLQAGVGAVVQLQALQAGEALAALGAVVVPQVLVGPPVDPHAAQQLEAFATSGALMRLPVGMGHLVEFQALGVPEGLLTPGAGQRLALPVRPAMEVEALVGDKPLVADPATVALLPLVRLQVLAQLRLLAKPVATEPAPERLCARVRAVVRLPVPLQGKGLVAVGTVVGLPALMDLLMDHQAHEGWVALPAPPALVEFPPPVGPQVSLQVSTLVETPVALWAVNHLPARARRTALLQLRIIICGLEGSEVRFFQK